MATNYPLVRIRNLPSNKVKHCRTFNHYRSVATGNAIHSTQFILPPWIETGASELCVIANGIASASLAVTVGRQPGIRAISPNADGRLELFIVAKDGALWHQWQTAVNSGWSFWASHDSAGGGFGISL